MEASRIGIIRTASLTLVALPMLLGACFKSESRDISAPPAPVRFRSVSVTRLDKSEIDLSGAVLSADSLTGMRKDGLLGNARVAIPRDSVQSIKERRVDWGKTSIVGAALIAGWLSTRHDPPLNGF